MQSRFGKLGDRFDSDDRSSSKAGCYMQASPLFVVIVACSNKLIKLNYTLILNSLSYSVLLQVKLKVAPLPNSDSTVTRPP